MSADRLVEQLLERAALLAQLADRGGVALLERLDRGEPAAHGGELRVDQRRALREGVARRGDARDLLLLAARQHAGVDVEEREQRGRVEDQHGVRDERVVGHRDEDLHLHRQERVAVGGPGAAVAGRLGELGARRPGSGRRPP